MKLLIVAATRYELSGLLAHFNISEGTFIEHQHFDVLVTGVGMTATAFALGKHLSKNYDLVLNVGIAGSFDTNLVLGSLVNVYSDCFAELGAEDHDRFITINDLGFGNNTYISSVSAPSLPKVKGITVNTVHGNAQSITNIKQRFDPTVESMEGAAVFYACEKSNIMALQVRAISNYVLPRDKEGWEIDLAISNLNRWILHFLNERNEEICLD